MRLDTKIAAKIAARIAGCCAAACQSVFGLNRLWKLFSPFSKYVYRLAVQVVFGVVFAEGSLFRWLGEFPVELKVFESICRYIVAIGTEDNSGGCVPNSMLRGTSAWLTACIHDAICEY